MPLLTIEAIRENPWNILTHTLPPDPAVVLLEFASIAALYCRHSEYLLIKAAREGLYTPRGWKAADDSPDVHEESEGRCEAADTRLMEFRDLLIERVGYPTMDEV
jgi:hypothetical protein